MPINKVVYGNQTIIDLTDSTLANASQLFAGITAYDRTGTKITGTGAITGGGVTQDQEGAIVLPAEGTIPDTYESGTVTLTERSFSTTIDVGATGFRYLLLFIDLTALKRTGVKYNCLIFADFVVERSSVAVQNNSGTDWLWWNNPFDAANATITRANGIVTITNTAQSVSGNTSGYFQPTTYQWIAWGE